MSLGGTKRTSSDVCNSVAIGGKAEVGFRACQGQLLAQSGRSPSRSGQLSGAMQESRKAYSNASLKACAISAIRSDGC